MSFLSSIAPIAGAIIGNMIAPGSGAVIGGMLGSAVGGASASGNAAQAQIDASNNATELQKQMFDQTWAAGQPYRDAGGAALGQLRDLLGLSGNTGAAGYGSLMKSFSPQDFLNNVDPGYQWQLQQGQQALQNSQAAGNGVLSGAALKDLMAYNQGMASTGYQNAFDRWQSQQNNIFGRLNNLTSLGENAAVNQGNTGANFANGMSNSIIGAGNAAASGMVGQANAINSGLGNAAGYYLMSKYFPGAGSSGSGGFGTSGLNNFFFGNGTSGD